jgi:hypothetical protein
VRAPIRVLAVLAAVGPGFFLYRTPTAPPELTMGKKAQYEAEVEQELINRMEV